jgi:sec-independent protein translocase protein TatC
MSEEKEMSFLDHLEELRWHVVRSLAAILIFFIAAWWAAPWIFDNIIFAIAKTDKATHELTFPTFKLMCRFGDALGRDWCLKAFPFKIQSRYMTGQFSMQFTASIVLGLIAAFPYVIWELWRFVRPGLYNKERRVSRGAVAAISFLFFSGVLFGYYVMCPMAVYFFANFSISDVIVNEFDITSYVGTIVGMILGSGVIFQLPVVIYFLTQIGLITPQFMRTYRKHAIIIILIIGAFVTPSPDFLSQAVISVPLYFLYELSIFISAYVVRQKRKEEEAELRAAANPEGSKS